MVAEFLPRKRHSDVVKAVSLMQNHEAHLIFVGDGPAMEAVGSLATDLGLGERVHFAGPQLDVRPYVLAARATILASSQEGLPRSIMESLCCGVPVIGADVRGIRDLLVSGGGVLYSCGDAGALASQLDWFAQNPDASRELGRQASEGMAPYEIASIIRLHEDLYALAVNDPKTSSLAALSQSR
jgi:glycosyltransferase involved in cell wall biosynthesis